MELNMERVPFGTGKGRGALSRQMKMGGFFAKFRGGEELAGALGHDGGRKVGRREKGVRGWIPILTLGKVAREGTTTARGSDTGSGAARHKEERRRLGFLGGGGVVG